MGNKLDATRISLEKGFTGVSDPTSTLSAITKGVNDIKTWQQEREAAANKLKTDTANSVRESTIEANKKLTGNKSVDTVILKALESTKNKLYTNEKLVQKNAKSPTDNLIFRQNAKQSYEILSQNLNDYDKNFQESLKRAKGYVGEDGNKIGGGAFEAGIQRVQTTLGNPNLYEIVSNDDGTMDISFYKTKINTTLNTRELVLDKEGNPIVDPTMSGMAATTFMKGKNQQSDRLYLSDEITKALAKGSALDTAYESIITQEGYTGVVLDDMRNSPGIKKLLYDYAKNATATSERRLSILADNMPVGDEQIVLMPNDVENFEEKFPNDQIDVDVYYEYFDIDTGLVKPGIYNKYVIAKLDPMSGLFINEESDDAKLASERIAVSSLYSGLKRKITGRDIDLSEEKEKDRKLRREENEKDRNLRRELDEKDEDYQGTVDLIDQAATGNKKSLNALVSENNEVVSAYNITGEGDNLMLEFIDMDGNTLAPIPLSGLGKDAGKQIAAQLQLKAQIYNDKSTLKDEAAKGIVSSYQTVTKEYKGLGNFDLGVTEIDGIKRPGTAAETFAKAIEGDPDEDEVTGVANTIIQKAIKEYSLDSNINVSFKEETGSYKDRYVITVDGVDYESPAASSSDNHVWLQKNMDRVLRGEKPSGGSEKKVDAFGNPIN